MSDIPAVSLVAWSGDASQLATRLNMSEPELLAGLRRLGIKDKGRLLITVPLHNTAPILSALRKRLNPVSTGGS